MKVALVYDRVNKWGGAERILLALKKIFPNADLFTSVYSKKNAPWASVFKIETTFLEHLPLSSSYHEFYATLMPIAFESFNFDKYDLVISLTSESAKGVLTKPGTLHICICLTPIRYLWSGYEDYFKNLFLKTISKPVVSYLRFWDKIAAQRPDSFIAISKEVQLRIKKYYNRDSTLIYPPITLKNLISKNTKGDYFLVVSRLVPYKRIDLAIKACKDLNLPLKIIGKGSEEGYLKDISSDNIEFLGEVSDKELAAYYQNCKALIFPGREDFGLVMAEALSFGKPVIAFGKGSATEIIKEGITGEFFREPTVESLVGVLINFSVSRYNNRTCQSEASRFSFERFERNLNSFLNRKLQNNL